MIPECSDHRLRVVVGEEWIFLVVFPELCRDNVFFTEKTLKKVSACLPKDRVQISMLT